MTAIEKMRAFYAITPGAQIYKKEFGFFTLDRWIAEGNLKPRCEVANYDEYLAEMFGYDEPARFSMTGLGWCEAAFMPKFEECVLEDRRQYELVRDYAGRHVLCFKGRRNGFMPEYVEHPVKDKQSWERDVKWRLDPQTPDRLEAARARALAAKEAAAAGKVIVQRVAGGYMYLRSLIGPMELPYMFYDAPELIHDIMRAWLELAERVTAVHQSAVAVDELFFGEDICYNKGALISPAMMREFLLPYYAQLYQDMLRRNPPGRKLHMQIDTDGRLDGVLDLYRGIGADYFSPFEVAAGCDIVRTAREYPDLLVSGGIDKRLIAEGGDALKRHLEYVMPPLRQRGGFIPTCDHGVPEETSFENYMAYRELMNEYCG